MNKHNSIEKVTGEVIEMSFTENDKATYETCCNSIKTEYETVKTATLKIAYCLYYIDKRQLYQLENYDSLADMAWDKFGVKPSSCNQFVNICKRFGSINDETQECIGLQPEYQDYGISQLREILPLPTEVIRELSPDMTIEKIREVKTEYKQGKKLADSKPNKKGTKSTRKSLSKEVMHLFMSSDINELYAIDKDVLTNKINDFKEAHPEATYDIAITLVYAE